MLKVITYKIWKGEKERPINDEVSWMLCLLLDPLISSEPSILKIWVFLIYNDKLYKIANSLNDVLTTNM